MRGKRDGDEDGDEKSDTSHGFTCTLTIAFDALRSTETTRSQYVPGALNRAVVAPHAGCSGSAHCARNVPIGNVRPVGPPSDAPAAGPSPNVTRSEERRAGKERG